MPLERIVPYTPKHCTLSCKYIINLRNTVSYWIFFNRLLITFSKINQLVDFQYNYT